MLSGFIVYHRKKSKGIFQTNIYLDVKILKVIMLRYLLLRSHMGRKGVDRKGFVLAFIICFLKLWYLSIKSIIEERGMLLCLRRYL